MRLKTEIGKVCSQAAYRLIESIVRKKPHMVTEEIILEFTPLDNND